MSEKNNKNKYCATCQQEIPAGKEIKIIDYLTSNYGYYNFSNRRIWDGGGYYSYPYAVYYLCLKCFRSYKHSQKKRIRKVVVLVIIIVVLIILLSFLLPLVILSLIRIIK